MPTDESASREEYAGRRGVRSDSNAYISLKVPLAGQRFGNYTLLREIGSGGSATLFLGTHIFLNTHAALKLVNLSLASREEVSAFQFEARLLAHLRHQHIVRALDFGWERGTPYLVMEHASGGTLEKRFHSGEPRPLAEILPFVKQIAGALQYVHNHSLVHCDIKPANLLLGPRDEVWLSDFGIAVIQGKPSYNPYKIRGTAMYMAPEQINGHPLPASDQYALAVMVYQWLCGTFLFEGTSLSVCFHQLCTPPPRLRDHVSAIPRAVERAVMKALAKDPLERFTYVLEFVRALERANSEW